MDHLAGTTGNSWGNNDAEVRVLQEQVANLKERTAFLEKWWQAEQNAKSVAVKIVPPSYGTDVPVSESDGLSSVVAGVLNSRYVAKDVHERAVAEMNARINDDAAKLGEKDHRIIAQERRIRELEALLQESEFKLAAGMPVCLTHETLLTDPSVQWVVQAIREGRDAFDRGVRPEDFHNVPATTLGGLLAGCGYDMRRLAAMLVHENHKRVVKPDMASDHANAAWIFQALQQGYDRGYRKDSKLKQFPTVDNQLFQFGYRAGKAQRKVDKRNQGDSDV